MHLRRTALLLGTAATLSLGASAAPGGPHPDGPYHVEAKWMIGGEGGWDYLAVDPQNPRLYVTHGARVEVLDTGSGKIVGAITGLQGTHGVAFDDANKYGYISDGRANAVVVFNRGTLEKVGSIPAGTNPDGITYEPVTRTVWAFNGRSHNVTVIDTHTQKAIATIDLPGKPEFPQPDGKGFVFDNIEDTNQIVRLDARLQKVTATWDVSGCESPSGLAIDTAKRHLFPVCANKRMTVIDADTGKILAAPPIGDHPDAAECDPTRSVAFSSNGEGTLTVIDDSSADYRALQELPTQKGGRTMAFDRAHGKIYIASAEFGPDPSPTAANPNPRPAVLPGTFSVIVVGR